MNIILDLIVKTGGQVWQTFLHNWPFLFLSVVLAALLKLYLDPQRISAFLQRYQKAGVVGATAVAVTTPLCSCGTTAIILGMMANYMPWAPIIAFMVSSPLTSPQELVYSAGLFGWRFALAFFAASIFLGLAGGAVGAIFDRRGWLANQTRQPLNPSAEVKKDIQANKDPEYVAAAKRTAIPAPALLVLEPAGCACSANERTQLLALETIPCSCDTLQNSLAVPLNGPACGCSQALPEEPAGQATCGCAGSAPEKAQPVTLRNLLEEMFNTGRRLLVMFITFAFIGYFLNSLIPPAWVAAIFGSGNAFSVPLAAILGLPLYVNSEASLPLVRAMLDSGMSQGAALAFLITGAGTSIGAVAGMLTIARWRVVALVIGTLLAGAALSGILYDLAF
jgi:uncharacterized membrane protein YraQ (UPF0718 family)